MPVVESSADDLTTHTSTAASACSTTNTLVAPESFAIAEEFATTVNAQAPTNSGFPDQALPEPVLGDHSVVLPSPFVGFVGTCFLYGCLAHEVQASVIANVRRPLEGARRSLVTAIQRWRADNPLILWLAVAVLTISVLTLSALFASVSLSLLFPASLLFVILLIATRFGNRAGTLATLGTVVVLEGLLYRPVNATLANLAVSGGWIWLTLIFGICSSALFGRRKLATRYKPWDLP
ncbi:MAG TPA: hypothetical protein VFA85_04100 [Terriglobales bacterium]|nr:hypothetical protein [Terriglobales bacterium]